MHLRYVPKNGEVRLKDAHPLARRGRPAKQQTAADGSGEARLLSSCEEHLDISALRQRIMDMQQMIVVNQQAAMATEIVIRNRDRLNLFQNFY